jgi:triphosphoribosyl-dephospho-CoA synthase
MGQDLTFGLAPAAVAEAFRHACIVDVQAFKPGNVSLASPGHGMRAEDFIASAQAAAAVMAEPGLRVGQRILRGIEATREVVAFNTNLGIVLLCAPLVHAAVEPAQERRLRARLRAVLAQLSVDDARDAYQAIRQAQPGGLGDSPRHDVSAPPAVTLLEAMREARSRDRIAWQYVSGFEDIFEAGSAVGREALARLGDPAWAAVSIYLEFLARYPDTHIARKYGEQMAGAVTREALEPARVLRSAAQPSDAMPLLESFDRSLKGRSLNPGTSADLTVATLLTLGLEDLLDKVYHGRQAAIGASEPAA